MGLNFKDIYRGWKNLIFKSNSVEYIARGRYDVCKKCLARKGSLCTDCGCYLPAKQRAISRTNDCPNGYWPIVTHYIYYNNNPAGFARYVREIVGRERKRVRRDIRKYLFGAVHRLPEGLYNWNEDEFRELKGWIAYLADNDREQFFKVKRAMQYKHDGEKG
jgi:hypothetical protein